MPAQTPPQPVLIGGGQTIDRPADPLDGREPLLLMEEAARRAAADAGGDARLLANIDTLAVANVVCHDYGDAPGMLAERLGCRPRRTIYTTLGGNTPQSLVSHLCDEIVAGRTGLALIAGAEAWYTMRVLSKAGRPSGWTHREATAPRWGDGRPGISELEGRHGAARPVESYPLYENAFRAARGLSLADHRRELATFAGSAAAIAAKNPYAWFRDGKSAEALITVTAENRMIGFPYPKFLNAILDVNQGAALLLANAETARRLGIAADRWVYPWAGVDVVEHWFLQDRVDYHSLPAMRRAGEELLAAVDVPIGRVRHLELYSCFPIASRLSAAMLGIAPDDPRPLTLTGALPWFGGPGNNYTTHAIATLVEKLRADRESVGLVHALGWILTKHGLGVYGGTPPPQGWRRAGGPTLQAWADALPHPRVVAEADGPGTIETYTVVHGRDGGPERGVVVGRLGNGNRFLATLPRDAGVLDAMERDEQVGRRGTVRCESGLNRFDPS